MALTTSDPSAAHVFTLYRDGTTSIVARFNNVEEVSAIVPFDDSSASAGLALLNSRNSAYLNGFDGGFAGGVFFKRALTETEHTELARWFGRDVGLSL